MLPHLDSAHNLARWLVRNDADAQDVVQEAYLRALRFFESFRGGDGKAWLLEIVRNTARSWLRRQGRGPGSAEPLNETAHTSPDATPEQALSGQENMARLRTCIEALPPEFREVLVMRELEEMSYREIGDATGLPPGTVMSRLSRARKRLEECAGRRAAEASR